MLYTYRLLYYWIFTLLPSHRHDAPFYERIWRKMCYKLLGWIRPINHWGKMQFLYEMNPGNASMEMREEDFNRVVLYVEGFMADIAHRHCEDAPDPVPPGRKIRGKIGLRALKAKAKICRDKANGMTGKTERMLRDGTEPEEIGNWQDDCLEIAKEYEELARIYRQLTGDHFENPYWEEFVGYEATDDGLPSLPDHVDKNRQREISDKASRFDSVTRKRRAHMHEQLQEICSVMAYD